MNDVIKEHHQGVDRIANPSPAQSRANPKPTFLGFSGKKRERLGVVRAQLSGIDLTLEN